jgi:hypothetical protein
VFEGAGIREQIAPANQRYYTELTENIVRDFLIDLSYNVTPESDRHFVAFTGEYGFAEFDKAMRNSASQYTLVDSVFVTGKGQDLKLGGQFKTYEGLNGTKITLKHLPLYDNTVRNRQLHWKTGRPIESYRFTILDFGTQGGESNIQKVYKKDSDMIMCLMPFLSFFSKNIGEELSPPLYSGLFTKFLSKCCCTNQLTTCHWISYHNATFR